MGESLHLLLKRVTRGARCIFQVYRGFSGLSMVSASPMHPVSLLSPSIVSRLKLHDSGNFFLEARFTVIHITRITRVIPFHLFKWCRIWYFWRPDASDGGGVKGYWPFVFVRPLDKQEVTLDASRGTSHGTLLLPLAQIWTDRKVYSFFVHGGRFCKSCV